jgi:bifunctional DNase/RNase
VLLREHDGERILPIWIGAHEGDALVYGRSGGTLPRPLGPDLTASLLRAGGVRVERVVIESLRENTYFATVIIASGGEAQEVDARPSDALNFAARLGVPVFAGPEVMDHAGIVSDEELSSRLRAGERGEAGTLAEWRSVTPDLLRSLWVGAEKPEPQLTERGQRVLSWAREEARALSHEHIEPEHILLGLLHDPASLAGRVLESLGITMALARPRVQSIEASGRELTDDEIALSPQARKVVWLAVSLAVSLGPGDAGAEHILLALARENALLEHGVDAERVREEVDRAVRALPSSEPSAGTVPPDPT